MTPPRLRSIGGKEKGAALIEFALVLPLLLTLTFLVIDFSRAFFMQNVLEQSAREAARALAVGADSDSINAHVGALAKTSGAKSITIALNPSYGSDQVRGEVSGTIKWIAPGLLKLLLPGQTAADSMRLKGVCTMRAEY